MFLANHEVIKKSMYFLGIRQVIALRYTRFLEFFADDVVTQLHALVADVNAGPGDQLAYLVLAFAAEGAIQNFAVRAFVILITHFVLVDIPMKIQLF